MCKFSTNVFKYKLEINVPQKVFPWQPFSQNFNTFVFTEQANIKVEEKKEICLIKSEETQIHRLNMNISFFLNLETLVHKKGSKCSNKASNISTCASSSSSSEGNSVVAMELLKISNSDLQRF